MATMYAHAAFGFAVGKLSATRRMRWLFWLLVGFLPMGLLVGVVTAYRKRRG